MPKTQVNKFIHTGNHTENFILNMSVSTLKYSIWKLSKRDCIEFSRTTQIYSANLSMKIDEWSLNFTKFLGQYSNKNLVKYFQQEIYWVVMFFYIESCIEKFRKKFHIYPWNWTLAHSSFPVTHKVGNVGIFVQLLMWINWKQLPAQLRFLQIHICHSVLI